MAYSELIKNFNKIRDYMRDFYVFGFKSRNEYDAKSARSYDNERRRIESWLGEYMSFRQDSSGKNVFISVDSRTVPSNPFYKAFKAKSFTDNDITLHFYLLDILSQDEEMTAKEIIDTIADRLADFDEDRMPDESTIRKKLKEYVNIGLIKCIKRGRENAYLLSSENVCLEAWQDAIDFFSEAGPLGVIGSYLEDKYQTKDPSNFRFKHHYILQTLDSEVLFMCLTAIGENRCLDLEVMSTRKGKINANRVFPLKIYISTQTGRHYLCAWNFSYHRITPLRLDSIKKISIGPVVPNAQEFHAKYENAAKSMWGVSVGNCENRDHLEMSIHVDDSNPFILNRLIKEGRIGIIERVDKNTYCYSADVSDAMEMLPWIRTFTGRIESFKCSNAVVEERFYKDEDSMFNLYGGEGDVI